MVAKHLLATQWEHCQLHLAWKRYYRYQLLEYDNTPYFISWDLPMYSGWWELYSCLQTCYSERRWVLFEFSFYLNVCHDPSVHTKVFMNDDQLIQSNVWWHWTMTLRLMNWDSSSDWLSNDSLWTVYLVWSCTKQFMNRCTLGILIECSVHYVVVSCYNCAIRLVMPWSYMIQHRNDNKWIVHHAMLSALYVEKWNSVLLLGMLLVHKAVVLQLTQHTYNGSASCLCKGSSDVSE